MYKFEWGPSSWGTYPYVESGYTGTQTSSIKISKPASALEPGQSYHFRVSATSDGGPATPGSEKIFTATPLTDYVALGDSYSAGTGTGPGFTGEPGCRQSFYSYPYLLHNAHTEWKFIDKACHGAETYQLIHSQAAALSEHTKWVTYTIGGNDAGFSDVLETCAPPGQLVSCMEVLATERKFIENTLPIRLDEVNNKIKEKAPYAKVIVLNYPRIFKGAPEDCNVWTFFIEPDMIEMNKLADLIGEKLHQAALRAGSNFIFKSVISSFSPHAVCSAEPWITNYSKSEEKESFHPNKLGHEWGYYPLVHGVTG